MAVKRICNRKLPPFSESSRVENIVFDSGCFALFLATESTEYHGISLPCFSVYSVAPPSMPISTEPFPNLPDFERNISSLIGVYSVAVCEREITETNDHYVVYRDWLVVCLRFHVEKSLRTIDESIRRLQEERSPADETPLGGNPLRDGVLTIALLTKENKAIIVFENDYLNYLTGIAFRVHPLLGNDPDEWWNEFLDFLAGYSHTNGKLKKYQGKCALRFWLRVVLWNFLRRRPIPTAAAEMVEDVSVPETNKDDLELNETIALFTSIVRDSLQTMPERDRLLLALIYIDNLRKKDIAAVFQVHPGQIGRREEAAVRKFRNEIYARIDRLSKKDSTEEIMGGIADNPKEFSEALARALKQLRVEDGN